MSIRFELLLPAVVTTAASVHLASAQPSSLSDPQVWVCRGRGWSRHCAYYPVPKRPHAAVAYELGAVALRFDPSPFDHQVAAFHGGEPVTYHLVTAAGDDRPASAVGARLRDQVSLGRTFYLANEIDVASIVAGPRIDAEVSARGTTTMMPASTSGFASQAKLAIGVHAGVGSITLGSELATGARIAMLTTRVLDDTVHATTQGWFLLEGRGKLDLWLSRFITLGVTAGVSVLDRNDVSLVVALGGHLWPYDQR